MKLLGDNLLTVIVLFVLGMLAYVIVVGGVLCIADTGYSYQEYLADLTRLHAIVIAAVVGALGRALLPYLDQRRNGGADK